MSASINAAVTLTPDQVAAAFWHLDSAGQAEFFGALDQLAGHRLCFQMAHVIGEIAERAGDGDHAPMHGMQTMLSHSIDYATGAAEHRSSDAKQQISILVACAKAGRQ
jgi:hypothetical protein